ncbi:MAG: MBG domain-containing protein, partial [Lachnospiraceae bacterium]|nr:MBG domain-containing protein [Lachnospiraceae bacterium]
ESDFTVDTDEETYSGSAITKTIVSSLTEDTDYAVTYANNTNAGTATITIAGTGNYTGSLTNEFIIEPKEITVSISGTTGNVYGGTITAATATLDGVTDADEGNVDVTLTYTGTANDGTEYESTEVPTLAGTYTVTATISDSNYSLTGTTTAEFVIAKATYDMSGVSFADATYTYDGTEKTLTITGSESLPEGVTVSYTDNSLTDVGSIEVTAAFSGDANNYEAIESKTATLTIINADFTVTVTGYEGVYDGEEHSITVIAEDGVTVTYCYSKDATEGEEETDGGEGEEETDAAEDEDGSEDDKEYTVLNPAFTDAGTYTVYYKASKANYNDVTGSVTVVITQAEGEGSVSITGWIYGEYDADTNSLAPVSATNGTDDVTYLYKTQGADDSTYTDEVPTDAGSYTVQATFAATNNYKAVTATADFTIAKAASGLSVGVDLELDKTYGDEAFALSATWTDTENAAVTYVSSDTSVAVVSEDGTVTIVGAGTAIITVSVPETDNCTSGSVEITLTVEKKDNTLTVTEVAYEVTYGDDLFTLDVTSKGGTVTYVSSDEDVVTVDENGTVTIVGVGEATISISIADSDNYNGTETTVTVTVNEAALTDVSVAQTGTLTYDGTTQTAAVTASAKTADGTDADVTFTYSTSEDGEYSTEIPAFTDAGTYTVYYRAEAANHETVEGSFTVTINKATYDMSGVSFEDATFEYDGGEKTLEISGTLPDGVTVTYSGNTLTEAGSITAIATFTGDMDNYGAIDLMMATLTITVLVELPEQTFPDEDAVHKVEVQEGLSEVPEALKENPDLDTVEEIEALLKTEVTAAEGYTTENSTVYNVTLMISFDGGLTWTKATAENFPADGLQVLLPYPEGTGKDTHDFVVTHMFTTTDFGKTPGETETPTVTKTDDGLVVTVTGLSPITIAWKEIGTESETESETAAQSETTAQSETQTESETAVQSETQTESETETKSETTAQSETETESQTAAAELESGTESPVQTGDETPISMWLTLFLLSAAALLMMGERKRQKR